MLMVGLLLMMGGFALAVYGLFYMAAYIIGFIGMAIVLSAMGLFGHYSSHSFKEEIESDEEYMSSVRQKQLADALEEARKNNEYENQVRQSMNAAVYAAMKYAGDLQVKYPLADKSLFDQYVNSYNTESMEVVDKIAEKIRNQHLERSAMKSLDIHANGITFDDVTDMMQIDERHQDDIYVTLYQKNNVFTIMIHNHYTGAKMIYSTLNMVLAHQIMNTVISTQMIKKMHEINNPHASMTDIVINDAVIQAANLMA